LPATEKCWILARLGIFIATVKRFKLFKEKVILVFKMVKHLFGFDEEEDCEDCDCDECEEEEE
jgi:hypothetical protein